MTNYDPLYTKFYSLYVVLYHVYSVFHLTQVNMIILLLFAGTKCCNYLYMSVVTMCYLTIKLESGICSETNYSKLTKPLFFYNLYQMCTH